MILNVALLNRMKEYDQPAAYFNRIHLSISDQRCLVAICNEGVVLQKGMHGVDWTLFSVVFHQGLLAIGSRCKQT